MKGLLMAIIGLAVGIYVLALLGPDAVTMLSNATMTGAPAAVKTMFTLILSICAVVAFILILLRGRLVEAVRKFWK